MMYDMSERTSADRTGSVTFSGQELATDDLRDARERMTLCQRRLVSRFLAG